MYLKSFCIGLAAMMAMAATAAFAHQNGPAPGTHITVAKRGSNLGDYAAMYASIQEAVNNARTGQVIEILDDSVYNEQVTIDGREGRTWPAPTGGIAPVGGKNGITIKYVPPTGAAVTARPTIKYQDTRNTSPKSCQEARTQGDSVGSSGNFETNGALRIIRASGVTIEGLIIDGGGSYTFSANNVWLPTATSCPGEAQYSAIFHGNAAVALAISHNIQIRDCQLRNAYFGVAVKDRNTGGIFGNPNPADNDVTIPLSGFGQTGNHLIEYNRVHNNDVGFYFESCWDLGSTIRYNLIYQNYHRASISKGAGVEDSDITAGAIIFKDIYITPLAIYNNTFYNNAAHLIGKWQVGYQHLIFNNIFGGRLQTGNGNGGTSSFMGVEHLFGNRMKHCVFSADQTPQANPNNVQFERLGQLNGQPVRPGASLPGSTQGTAPIPIPAAANVRWLETTFQNTNDATSTTFLEPNWSQTGSDYLKDYGWPDAGILDADASAADLGAVSSDATSKRPCDGKAQTSRGRVSPYGFVTITGGTAVAKITISQEVGSLTGLTVKYLRWITPVPDNTDKFGQEGTPVPSGSIRTVTATAPTGGWQVGANQATITVPTGAGTYGFFEIVFEGKDANGKTVTTDVGFLPYRQLDYYLDIKLSGSGVETVGGVPTVMAGTPVTMTVTAMDRTTRARFTGGSGTTQSTRPLDVAYSLSLVTSRIFQSPSNAALTEDDIYPPSNTYTKDYQVYFTKAMESEVITGAGLWCNGPCEASSTTQRLPFPGDLVIRVRPGPPDKVVFQDPIPKSQLAGGTPATIVGTYPVTVQVQDKYDNAVDTKVSVAMESLMPDIGGVQTPAADTDPATGNAEFTATITNGAPGQVFDLRASSGTIKPDTGSLRVGRAADGLRVFYYESQPPKHGDATGIKGGYWMDDYEGEGRESIDAIVGERRQVWVKVLSNAGDSIITSRSAFVCVAPSVRGIQFSAAEGGPYSSGSYSASIVNGVATFWITADSAVDKASLTVSAKLTAGCGDDRDNGIADGRRGDISFTQPAGGVGSAFVKGDGYGRPNYVEIAFTGDGTGGFNTVPETWRKPDSVKLVWPCVGGASATSAAITYLSDSVIGVTFNPAAYPEGYSAVSGSGALLEIFGAINMDTPVRNPSALIDSIGPLVARPRIVHCGAEPLVGPTFGENKSPGVTPYELRLQISEPLALAAREFLVGPSILISSDSAGTDERALIVAEGGVAFSGDIYTLTLSPTSLLVDGYWIRLNYAPGHPGITDAAGVRVAPDNRRVQIKQQEAPAGIKDAWYTTADNTGVINFVYITFDKPLTAADIPEWFNGGNFSFDWAGVGVIDIGAGNIDAVTIDAAIPNTIRVNMAAMAEAERNRMTGGIIRTGRNIDVVVTFNDRKKWAAASRIAVDAARPVLVSAVLQRGSANENDDFDPDTLILTFSEDMSQSVMNIANPVSIKHVPDGDWNSEHFTVRTTNPTPAQSQENGVYHVFKYVLVSRDTLSKGGELVSINDTAGVADAFTPPNVQDQLDNHPVPLEIRLGKPFWRTRVKGNPFRERVVVATSPGALGKVVVADIRLYDNMGKLVVEELGSRHVQSADANNHEWVWDGRNKNGRVVGTGTYIFKAVYKVEGAGEIAPHQVSRAIGFVRGKQQ